MEYTCENQQHFVWGTRLRLKDSEGKVKTVDENRDSIQSLIGLHLKE